MWTSNSKIMQHLILLQLLLGQVLPTAGLLSDYKTCGDQACARLMCRVQAQRDHHARDCRFLSFRKGDMIDVYHKLSGRRNKLWAGSNDKDFGYFPKAAVILDEVFVDEKQEMEMQTQETDFLCMDAFGTIIPSQENFEEDFELGDETDDSEDLGNIDFDDQVSKSSEPNANVKARLVDQKKDQDREDQRQASWIGAAVSGWFASDAGDPEDKEENFRSKNTAINMEQLDEKWQVNKALDWAEHGMSSILELKEEEMENDKESTQYLGNRMERVSGFEAGEDTSTSKTKKPSLNENMQIPSKDQEVESLKEEALKIRRRMQDSGWYDNVFNAITNFYGDPSGRSKASKNEGKVKSGDGDPDRQRVQTISKDKKNPADYEQKQEVNRQDDHQKNKKLGEGWYGSVYNRITEFYGDTPNKSPVDGNVDPNLEESMTEDNNAGWYSSIYSKISNVYSEPSHKQDVPDGMRESQSQTLTESTKETSSETAFLTKSLSTGRDIQAEEGSNDETKTSQCVESKLVSPVQSDDDDDNDGETLEPSDKKNIENLKGSSHINVFLMKINIPKSSLKLFEEDKTPDKGEEEPSDKEDDELSITLTKVEKQGKNEEEALHEENVSEAQTHSIEGSLDTFEDVRQIHLERNEISGQSDSTSLLTHEPNLTSLSEHISEEPTENSETVDESEETLNEDGGSVMLTETKETETKTKETETKKRRDREQINHTEPNTEEPKQSVNIALMKDDEKPTSGDVIETEIHGNKGVDVIPAEFAEKIKDVDGETDGEKVNSNIPQMESAGKNTSGKVSRVKNAGGHEDPQNKVTQINTNGEKEGDSFMQMVSGGQKLDEETIQKEQLSHQNSYRVVVTNPNEKVDSAKSRKSETPESTAFQWSPSTHAYGADVSIANPPIRARTQREREKHRNKIINVKCHKTQTSAQTQKSTYTNIQPHLSEKDMNVLLRFFSEETLTRLDFIIGHSENSHSNQPAEVHEFEQRLEHLLNAKNEEIKPSLQSIHTVLAMLSKTFRHVLADGSVDNHQDQMECVTATCGGTPENTLISELDTRKENNMDTSSNTDDSHSDQEKIISDRTVTSHVLQSELKPDPHLNTEMITEEHLKHKESRNGALVAEFLNGVFMYTVEVILHTSHAIHQVVMSLPDDIRPGPDLYGVPWEAALFTATLGFLTFMLFTCRFFQAIKSRLYCSKEQRMGQKVTELLEEKCKVLQMLSECEHKFENLQAALQNGGLSAQALEREDLEVLSKQLEEVNVLMQCDMEKMQEELETQDQLRKQQEEQIENLTEMLKKLEQEATERKSQLEQDKTTLKIHQMNTERLQKKLQQHKVENSMLQESKAQLEQEAEGWKERLSELEEERNMCETSHNRMMENNVNKDESIKSLTECLLNMRDWDSEDESTVNDMTGSVKNSQECSQKQKIQKLINAAKMSADLKAIEEDNDRMFAKLTDEIKAKEDLQGGLDQLEREKELVQSESSVYSSEIEKLQHKLQIMSEMYQEKELKLHRMLTVEEKERSEKEEQLNKAGKKISLATDELNSYRQRAKELEEELEKTNQSYRNQIASHEKKAHDNWLAARAADRDLADVKRENSALRQRLTDWQFKLELIEKNPQAGVLHFRGERSPFGPSPLGRPPSETRPFLSPPTLMDGPSRVSPQFPMMPSGRAPPGGVEGDRSVSYYEGGSPTWERERERELRGLPPPGPDPGLVYRRPLSAPFPRAPLPSEAYFNDKSDSSIGGGAGFSENEMRDNGRLIPGPDTRAGPFPPPPFPPMDPRDPHLSRRAYRSDFFPPQPQALLSMRGLLPPGVFSRIPLPPHLVFPPTRFQSNHVSPEPPSRPSPPGSEQPPEQPPLPHDII